MAIGRIPEPLAGIQETILDAKGDLISATAADTPARLAVGSNNQILMADSTASTGIKWAASATSTLTTKGDLLAASAANTLARLPVGTNGYTLVADSAETTGLKWAAPAGGGKVLQVIHGYTTTEASSSSTTFADTGLTATITPTLTTSKILVLVSQNGCLTDSTTNNAVRLKLFRGATELSWITDGQSYNSGNLFLYTAASFNWLDSPATTSATTYKTQFSRLASSGTVYVQNNRTTGNSGVSTITLLEIGA